MIQFLNASLYDFFHGSAANFKRLPKYREFCEANAFVKILERCLELKDDKNKEFYNKQDCLVESIAASQ